MGLYRGPMMQLEKGNNALTNRLSVSEDLIEIVDYVQGSIPVKEENMTAQWLEDNLTPVYAIAYISVVKELETHFGIELRRVPSREENLDEPPQKRQRTGER